MKHFFRVFLSGAATLAITLLCYLIYLLLACFLNYYTDLLYLSLILLLFLAYCVRAGKRAARRHPSIWNGIVFISLPALFACLEIFTHLDDSIVSGVILDSLGVPFLLILQHGPWFLPRIAYEIGPEVCTLLAFWLGEYTIKRKTI